jgi:hypothetical protein
MRAPFVRAFAALSSCVSGALKRGGRSRRQDCTDEIPAQPLERRRRLLLVSVDEPALAVGVGYEIAAIFHLAHPSGIPALRRAS